MFAKQVRRLLSLLQIQHPIIQAPMAGITTPEFVSLVSNAGALGSIAAGYLSPADLRSTIRETKKLTGRPLNVNLFIPEFSNPSSEKIYLMNLFLNRYRETLKIPILEMPAMPTNHFEEQLEIIIEEKIPIFSFTFGIPSVSQIQKLKQNGILIIGTATTVKEAIELEEKGCDAIVAQGSEAGGHRGSFQAYEELPLIGSMALIPQIVDQVKVPVIAAGSIMDGRGLVAALALGASAVQMGTAFLTCLEASTATSYKEKLLSSKDVSTVITTVFSGRPARGIKNRFIEEMKAYNDNIPNYPIQNALTQDIRKAARSQDCFDYLSLWAGQGSPLSQRQTVVELIQKTLREAELIGVKC